MRFLVLAALTLASLAYAADDDEDLFKEGTVKKSEEVDASRFSSEEDELGIPTFATTPKPEETRSLSARVDPSATQGPKAMPLDTAGKAVLGDNWAPTVVIADKDAVVVDVPVLYGRSRAEFDGVPYWLVAETYSDGKKVAESRMMVTREAIADQGPSVQFFRVFVPVPGPSGTLELKVSKLGSAATAKPEPLFTRSVAYKL